MQAPLTAAAGADTTQPSSEAPNNFLAGADQNTLNMFSTMIQNAHQQFLLQSQQQSMQHQHAAFAPANAGMAPFDPAGAYLDHHQALGQQFNAGGSFIPSYNQGNPGQMPPF